MKSIYGMAGVFVLFFLLAGAARIKSSSPPKQVFAPKSGAIACGFSQPTDLQPGVEGKFIPLLPGLGQHSYPITAANDSARLYFDQGLNFYYSYHFREARASFKEAARFDKNCAMAYWGQALAMGPYYNNYYYKMPAGMQRILQLMNSNQQTATKKEKQLIGAMQQRYSEDSSNADRPVLDSKYAIALQALTVRFPADVDIKALYIDAIMLQHKWDFWSNNGRPKEWTPELLSLCKTIFKIQPEHPAALHYYIHLTEASKHPQQALSGADVLRASMPGAGHMVHMATHMYQRNGLYAKGVTVNEEANTVNNHVDELAPNLGIGKDKIIHVYAVQSFCALNAGMYHTGMPLYMRARNRVLALSLDIQQDPDAQGVFMLPVMAMVRLGKWQDILEAPAPDSNWKYASILDDFARGMAHIRSHHLPAAKQHLQHLEYSLKDSLLQIRIMPFNAPVQCARIAAGILAAAISMEEGDSRNAVAAFETAVKEEDYLIYREPQEWQIPVRQYYGSYLLKIKKAAAAEKIYRQDLIANPSNGWSLMGLCQALQAQRKFKLAARYKPLYEQSFQSADVRPVGSVF